MNIVHVLAPDSFSGETFNRQLVESGIQTDYKVYNIPPRVILDKISTSMEIVKVLNTIFESLDRKIKDVAIACNTLQLWVNNIDAKHKRHFRIFTTFEACNWKFKNHKDKPLWLGTTPLVHKIKRFDTLLSKNEQSTQDLVQELIWRVKMYGDNDISSSVLSVKNDVGLSKHDQYEKMEVIKEKIIESLNRLNVKDVILGCTELPIIFRGNRLSGINFFDPASILAEYIKSVENPIKSA